MSRFIARLISKIIIYLSIVVVIALCIEAPFRIYDFFRYSRLFKNISQESGNVAVPFDEVQVYLYKTGKCIRDPELFWKYTSKLKDFKLNSLGIRDYEILTSKPLRTYRIFIFGGSHPFGLGVDYEDTYAKQLEKMLSEINLKSIKEVQVINAAIPGFSSLQVLRFLKRDIVSYQPDLVIIDVGTNDMIELTDNWPLSDSQIPIVSSFRCKISNILYRSSFFWHYRKFLNRFFYKSLPTNARQIKAVTKKKTRLSPQEYNENAKRMAELARNKRFEILFLTQMVINPEGKLIDPLKGYYIEPRIDIFKYFKQKEKNINKYMLDNIHASKLGHRRIAEILFDYLTKEELIKIN
jgi:lysophospholipase L1-like esterase